MTSLDPRDTPADLRSYADLLRDLAADREAVRTPEAVPPARGMRARLDETDLFRGRTVVTVSHERR